MTDDERDDFERELAELRERAAQRQRAGPPKYWSGTERRAVREDATRARWLLKTLIEQSRRRFGGSS